MNVKGYVMIQGNTMNSHEIFLDRLKMSSSIQIVNSIELCDVIIAFVPIVSRAGTNIQDAMEKIPVNKRVVLVVLHHTFDPYYIAPDSRWCVNSDWVFAVDCLYHEDKGLLDCVPNDEAIKAVKQHLKKDQNVDFGYHSGGQDRVKHQRVIIGVSVAVVIFIFIFIILMVCLI